MSISVSGDAPSTATTGKDAWRFGLVQPGLAKPVMALAVLGLLAACGGPQATTSLAWG